MGNFGDYLLKIHIYLYLQSFLYRKFYFLREIILQKHYSPKMRNDVNNKFILLY
jgi:hypothetical protein